MYAYKHTCIYIYIYMYSIIVYVRLAHIQVELRMFTSVFLRAASWGWFQGKWIAAAPCYSAAPRSPGTGWQAAHEAPSENTSVRREFETSGPGFFQVDCAFPTDKVSTLGDRLMEGLRGKKKTLGGSPKRALMQPCRKGRSLATNFGPGAAASPFWLTCPQPPSNWMQ